MKYLSPQQSNLTNIGSPKTDFEAENGTGSLTKGTPFETNIETYPIMIDDYLEYEDNDIGEHRKYSYNEQSVNYIPEIKIKSSSYPPMEANCKKPSIIQHNIILPPGQNAFPERNVSFREMKNPDRNSLEHLDEMIKVNDAMCMTGDFGELGSVGGLLRFVPIDTVITTEYVWKINNLQNTTDDKLVSMPFGPRDWQWQLIVYPRGIGENLNKFVSVFIKPIKSSNEIAMGESWKRPIFQFSFAVKDINGILKYDHASGADFEHFSNETPGWGCNDFIPYPIEESIIFNNETSIEILVSGVQTNQEATFIHQDLIPSAQSSFTFGPSSCAWKLTLNHNNGWISAYLNPVLSELENRATDSAPRMISALTVKFLDSTTLQPFVSKCITGGFVFDGQPAGWHNFYQANVLDNCLVYIEVTWDPKLFSKLTRDKHRLSVVDVISDSHLENIATLNAQVSALRDQLIYVKPIVDRTLHSEERTLQLMEELRTSRTEDQEMNYHRTKLCELKLKLIKIRGMMESDHQTTECLKFDSMNVDVLPLLEINANLELKIANLLGELSCANSQLVDQGLLEPLEDAVSLPEFADTLALKIRNAQEENLKALDANFTLQGKVLETKCEQMAVIAELSMVVCGCDVALADLYELKDQVEQPHQEFDKAISDLEIVIPNLISMRKNILETPFHSEIGGRPSVPPPILPSSNPIRTKSLFLDIKETKSPKELPMESVESFPHADLVKRIEELKDLLNARDRISLIDAEPWTPIKEKDEELEEFFRNLPRNRSYFTIFMYYCTWFLSLFIIFSGFYSTFFIICDSKEMSTRSHTHPFVYYHGVCSKIVNPIFRNVKDVLHHNVAMFVENSHLTISAFDAEIVAQYIRVWIQDKVNKSLEKVLARNDIPISATLALEAKVKTSSTLLSTVLEAVESKDIYVSLESMVEKTSSNDDPAVHIKLTESPTLSSEYEKIKGKVVPKSFSEGEVNGFDKNVTLNTILDDAADVKRKLSLEASTTVLDAILEAVKSKDMYVSLESSIEKTSRNDDANGLDKKITSNMKDETDIHSGINKSGAVAENDGKLALEASKTVPNAILEAVKSKDMYVSLESIIEKPPRNDGSNGLDKKITSNKKDESDIHSGINKSGAVAENDDAELAMEASTTLLNDILEAVKSEDTYVSLESSVENISRNDDSTSLSQNDDEVNNHGEL